MKTLATILSLLALTLAASSLLRVRSRAGLFLLIPKFLMTAWAHYVALAGAAGAALGLISGAPVAIVFGLAAAAIAVDHVRRVTARHEDGLERAFGADWRRRLRPGAEGRMLGSRWSWRVPPAPAARVTRDLPFCTLPDGERRLLCDLWQPAAGVEPSGAAIVYLHGSAWYLIDKDVGTRPMFGHLAAQGHVVMDVAYRLCPETNFTGMVSDAKRAVAWMKAHAAEYGVDPEQVVLMGASAGAHVALVAAYAPDHASLTPEELRGEDLSVRAVVSYYGIPDLRAYEAGAHAFEPRKPAPPRRPPGRFGRAIWRLMFGRDLSDAQLPPPPPHRQIMRELVGGLPDEVPEMYALASPIHHVSASSPATLLLQGGHDQIVPLDAARQLHRALVDHQVPAVYIEYPRTGHAFDFIVPALFAPAAQAALYDVERFLACALARSPSYASIPFRKSSSSLSNRLQAASPSTSR